MFNLTYKNIIKIGYVICLAAGFLLHFAYDFFNNNLIIGLFTPVNESVAEHLKLIFLPFTLFTIFFYFYSKKKITNLFLLSFISNILGTAATTITFYTGIKFLGMDNTIFNIGTYIVGMTIAFITFYLGIYNDNFQDATKGSNELGICAFLLLTTLFIVNTVLPVKLPINKDPVSNTYGIFKIK
ncbi:MAG: hypothetical protein IKL68_03375 [Clostridia bacterium]|nr:hypothetical protein [Clostridia bacterium]